MRLLVYLLLFMTMTADAQIHVFNRLSTLTDYGATVSDSTSIDQIHVQFGIYIGTGYTNENVSMSVAQYLYVTSIHGSEEHSDEINLYAYHMEIVLDTSTTINRHTKGYVKWTHQVTPNNVIIMSGWFNNHKCCIICNNLLITDHESGILRIDQPAFVKRL